MKRIFAVLAIVLSLALCGCNAGGPSSAPSPSSTPPPQSLAPSQSSQSSPASQRPANPKNKPSQGAQNAAAQEPGGQGQGDLIPGDAGQSVFTLFADFSAGVPEMAPETKDIALPPQEDMPASNALIAFFLADSLSEWTGLDFALNDVTFGENSITVDWAASSTLVAGLDDRAQKEEFHFFDAIGLNWFMMDSLAQTLKYNFAVSTVYYCCEGGPVTFTNPEDMAAEGLPLLPVDQPYEGSVFFVSRAGGRG